MIFVRTGPRFLFLETENNALLKEELAHSLGGSVLCVDSALEKAEESETIIFFKGPGECESTEMKDVLLAPLGSSVILSSLINSVFAAGSISRADLGPGLLLQRIPRSGQKVIETIQRYYEAESMDLETAIRQGKASDTVVVFTDRPLNKPVCREEVEPPVLLINREVPVLYRELRQEAVRYFTEGLESGQWREVRIKIYDSAEYYDIHYRRLVLALEDLEAGLILGESWTRDHALALFAVLAYQVRLFTPLELPELKQVLMGLEFDSGGARFVDLDLYQRWKKIEKAEVFKCLPDNLHSYGIYLRERLFTSLSVKTKEKINNLEELLQYENDD
ncbi:MAG: hypothetical protein K9L17_04240 [Clostridiales bacterium]|nr:hypothetical protein [Clostridiales bacterium]MCF8021890.1 hypothetical protein [Clostridiales bacterium]